MSARKRSLRSGTAASPATQPPALVHHPMVLAEPSPSYSSEDISILHPGSMLPGLDRKGLNLLRRKQRQLAANAASVVSSTLPNVAAFPNTLAATLIFGHAEAGTAVCVDPEGWILTCSHYFGDSESEWRANKQMWLLFYTGLAVQVECRAWEPRADLALAKVVAVEYSTGEIGQRPVFSYVSLAERITMTGTEILCIGQPGRDDLESATRRKTTYDLVEVSEGRLRGIVPGADPLDNSAIGALKHDAWTYWGHSGAPLLEKGKGFLVGLHSSWDDETGMRHGIPLVAIRHFLERHLPLALTNRGLDPHQAVSKSEVVGPPLMVSDRP